MQRKIIAFSLVATTMLFANETIQLDEIVTIGTKTKNTISNLPMQTSVISSEDIENSGASNVGEILNAEGSIYVNTSGGNGATMSIRGMAHGDTLILIDGRRVTGEFSKTYELDRIPAGMVDRIEIVKGSSSLLYGSDSMGGVVNIITKKTTKSLEGDVQIVHGKNKNGVDANILGKVGDTSYKVYSNIFKRDAFIKRETTDVKVMQGGVEKSPSVLTGSGVWATLRSNLSDSYTVNHDYQDEMDLKSIGFGISHILNDYLKIDIDMSYLKEDKNAEYISNVYETNYVQGGNTIKAKYVPVEQFDDNKRVTAGGGITYNPNDKLEIKYDISYSQYDKDRKVYTSLWSELGYSSKEDSLSSENLSTIKHLNNNLLATYTSSKNNRFLAGADYRITNVQSNAYDVDDRNYKDIFLQHEYRPVEKLNLIYGARYDKDSIGDSKTSLSFGGTYELSEKTKIKANYSQGFRSPDDRELYVDQTSPSGKRMLGSMVIDTTSGKTTNWDLKPETSDTFEIGFSTKGDNWNFDVTGFKTDIKDRISQRDYGTYFSFENIAESEIKGFESSFAISPADNFKTKITYSHIDAKNTTDDIKLSYTPENLLSFTLSYYPIENLELRSITKYIGKQTDSSDNEIGGFTLTNIKAVYLDAFKNIDIFLGVDNIFNKNIPDEIGYIEKFNYYAGMKYKF